MRICRSHQHMKIGVTGNCHTCSTCSRNFHRASRQHHCSLRIWCQCSLVSIQFRRVQINVETKSTWQSPLLSIEPKMVRVLNIMVYVPIIWKDLKKMKMCICSCESKFFFLLLNIPSKLFVCPTYKIPEISTILIVYFEQCIEFSFTKRSNKAYYSYWARHGHRTIPSVLAALGLFERTRSEYTSNFWHSHVT